MLAGIAWRNGGYQSLGVGMLWVAHDGAGRAFLDDPAEVHHGDPVREVSCVERS
jgi:hypothetical protein